MTDDSSKETPSIRQRIRRFLDQHSAFEVRLFVGEARLVGPVAIVPITKAHIAVTAAGENPQVTGGALGSEPLAFVIAQKDGRAQLASLPEGGQEEAPEEAQAWAELGRQIPGLKEKLAESLRNAGWKTPLKLPQL